MLTVGGDLADGARCAPIALNRVHKERTDSRFNDRCGTMRTKTITLFFQPLYIRGKLIVIHHDGFAIARAARAIFDRRTDGRRDGVEKARGPDYGGGGDCPLPLFAKEGDNKDRAERFPEVTDDAHPPEDLSSLRRLSQGIAEQE